VNEGGVGKNWFSETIYGSAPDKVINIHPFWHKCIVSKVMVGFTIEFFSLINNIFPNPSKQNSLEYMTIYQAHLIKKSNILRFWS
jgi:hypothetical protein